MAKRSTETTSVGMRRNLTRVLGFLRKEHSVSVFLMLLVVVGLGGVALRLIVFQSWFLWFWGMTALTAFALFATAAWDLIVDLRGGSLHLVTDQPTPWGAGLQWSIVPVLLIAGILFDHFVTH